MFLISVSIEHVQDLNFTFVKHGFERQSYINGLLRFVIINLLLAFMSGFLVIYIAPEAAGSGIPDVKVK